MANKSRIEIPTGSADLSESSFRINKEEVGLSSNQVKEEIDVYGRKIEKALEVSQPEKPRQCNRFR